MRLMPILLFLLFPAAAFLWLDQHHQELIRSREQQLATAAEAVASALGGNATLVTRLSPDPAALHADSLPGPVNIDGRDDDWAEISSRQFGLDELISVNAPYETSSLTFSLRLAADASNLYLFYRVIDNQVVYREIGNPSVQRNDHIRLVFATANGVERHTLAVLQPGAFEAHVTTGTGRSLRTNPVISGWWLPTEQGYNVELVLPRENVRQGFSTTVIDVDDPVHRTVAYQMGNAEDPVPLFIFDDTSLAFLNELPFDGLTVIDGQGREVISTVSQNQEGLYSASAAIEDGVTRVGTLTVMQQDLSLDATMDRATTMLLVLSTAVVLSALLLQAVFHRKQRQRIALLADQLNDAVRPDGRVVASLPTEAEKDELEALRRTLAALVDRLRQYNDYVERMAGRLSHELRTPVSVVRSSLESLDQVSEQHVPYIERANAGVARLTLILSKMSEARRLEQSLDAESTTRFDLTALVRGCVEGYRGAYPSIQFALDAPDAELPVIGIPEMMAQMLDKLVDNAVEFSEPDAPVRVRLTQDGSHATLRVLNRGPELSGDEPYFDAMVSVRDSQDDGHLGLGLTIARMITDFHGGSIRLINREDEPGVIARVSIPLMRLTAKLA